ncbi:acylphosphatase [Francisella persica]|nr:acylphosphatase [Francisella persica]
MQQVITKILVNGVQGVGFRHFIYYLAKELGLNTQSIQTYFAEVTKQ